MCGAPLIGPTAAESFLHWWNDVGRGLPAMVAFDQFIEECFVTGEQPARVAAVLQPYGLLVDLATGTVREVDGDAD